MGAGIPTTPPVTGEAIAQLMDLTRQVLVEQRETNRLLRKDLELPNPWMTPDEAAVALGKEWTASGEHRKVLCYCRRHDLLTIFGQRRPYTYSRKEVMELQKKVIAGDIALP